MSNSSGTPRKAIVLAPGQGRAYPMGRISAVFKADEAETESRYSVSEWFVEPGTQGPGAHAHAEDDLFYVIEGVMSIRVGEEWLECPKGSFVLVPGGVTHDFENRGSVRAGILNFSSPGPFEPEMPGIVEWFAQNPPKDTEQVAAPDETAVRVALWRALHVEIDAPPHVFEDVVGLKLAAPDDDWRSRPDMSPFTRPFRASIVARARFIEDLVAEQVALGVGQYVILGAGLDTFAQRRPELASRLLIFEIDRPGPQSWKRRRLLDLGLGIPSFLRFVPVDFEAGAAWWERLSASGFDAGRPAVVASTGVSMYLTRDAIAATLRQVAAIAPGSTLAMSFMLPIELADPEVRPGIERAVAGARASGTPFISFFTPAEMLKLALDAGFRQVRHVSAASLAQRYFTGRSDGLRPPDNSEELLVATT